MNDVVPDINNSERVSPIKLTKLLEGLTDTQKKVLSLLDEFHYAYGSQIQRLFFFSGSQLAMTRARNRLLTNMVNNLLLYRYPRHPLTGKLHGSTEHIYALAHAGQRVMNELRFTERPYRSIDRTTSHFQHALYVTELYVLFKELERASRLEVITAKGEPSCHRHFGSNNILKPDAFFRFHIIKAGQKFEVEWFIEVEHSRHSESNLITKVSAYRAFMEQLDPDKEFMPRVLFIAFNDRHRKHLSQLLERNVGTDQDVFATSVFDNTIHTLMADI